MALKCYTTVHDTRRLDRDHCTATWCASKQASLKRVMTRVPACECSLRGSNTISRYESRQLRMVSMIRDNLLPHVSSCTALYKGLYSLSIRLSKFGEQAFESALHFS
jgi:hypothetical protein